MIDLSTAQRRSLRARAHPLRPVVLVGQQGLTPAVVHEIDIALNAHELIKIRVHDDDRDVRENMLARVCDEVGAAPVQHLGKLLIVFRPKPQAAPVEKRPRASTTKRKPSGTSARKTPAPHFGGKGKSRSSRQTVARFGDDQMPTARKGVSRALTAARSNEFSPRTAPALAPEAPRRRRRVVVMAATHAIGAPNKPPVRRRRKNP